MASILFSLDLRRLKMRVKVEMTNPDLMRELYLIVSLETPTEMMLKSTVHKLVKKGTVGQTIESLSKGSCILTS